MGRIWSSILVRRTRSARTILHPIRPHIRTVPMPAWVKRAVDSWTEAVHRRASWAPPARRRRSSQQNGKRARNSLVGRKPANRPRSGNLGEWKANLRLNFLNVSADPGLLAGVPGDDLQERPLSSSGVLRCGGRQHRNSVAPWNHGRAHCRALGTGN